MAKTRPYSSRAELLADLYDVVSWAERDQRECMGVDEDGDREGRRGLATIRRCYGELRRLVKATMPTRAQQRAAKKSGAALPVPAGNAVRFECCGKAAGHKSERCPDHDGMAEPC